MHAQPPEPPAAEPPDRRSEPAIALSDLDFDLPEQLIAQSPAVRRDAARMLVLHRRGGAVGDARIADLPDRLRPGDLLVLNDTKVIPAQFTARRATGGSVGGLFLSEPRLGIWRVLLRGARRLRAGESLSFEHCGAAAESEPASDPPPWTLHPVENHGQGEWTVRLEPAAPAHEILDRIGETPLPPYIRRQDADEETAARDRARYQTVYARAPGSVAAPTAGLHFTCDLLERIRAVGVTTTTVTLHVGLGTFKPITATRIDAHVMHSERFTISDATVQAIADCRGRGGRIVAVGTTSVRALEAAAAERPGGSIASGSAATDIFIYPPYRFRVVDALLTNFHLPRSTLLALVMAFAGIDATRRAYEHAVAAQYRFFSYGDAMLIE